MSDTLKLKRLEAEEVVVTTPDGTIEIGGAHGTSVELRDRDGHVRVSIGHLDGGVWQIALYEPEPGRAPDTRCRAAMELDAFGTVAIWVSDGRFAHRHTVGLEAVPLEDYGNPKQHTMLALRGGGGGTAQFFNAAPTAAPASPAEEEEDEDEPDPSRPH